MKYEGKTMTGEKHEEIKNLLAVYQSASCRQWNCHQEERDAYGALNKSVAKQSAAFGRKVRRRLSSLRKGWRVDKATVELQVDHSTRPYSYHAQATIVLNFYDEWRRGEVRLYGSIDKADDLIQQLRDAFCEEDTK